VREGASERARGGGGRAGGGGGGGAGGRGAGGRGRQDQTVSADRQRLRGRNSLQHGRGDLPLR
jgi:hypothetical protein